MFIRKLVLKQIKGVDALEVLMKPGCCTIVSGENGAGKSSIADSFIYLEETSHNPNMIRDYSKGNKKGEITIEIGDPKGEFDGALIQCVITPEKTTRTLRHPKLGKIGVAESKKWLQSALTMICLDPLSILDAKPAEQARIFLESLPIRLTSEQLSFLPEDKIKGIDYGKHALEVIGSEKSGLMGLLYDDRREQNILAGDKEATARTIESSLPPPPPEGDWLSIYNSKVEELQALRKSVTDYNERIRSTASTAVTQTDDSLHSTIEQIKKALFARIEELRKQAEAEIELAQSRHGEQITQIYDESERNLKTAKAEYDPVNQQLVSEISQAKTMLDQEIRAGEARRQAEALKQTAAKLGEVVKQYTGWIDQLKELRVNLVGQIPIPGLEFVDGEIIDNGLPLSTVNDAEKYRVVFEIAKMRMGPLGFMVMDGFEQFDEAHRKMIFDSARKAGIQLLAATRTEGPLSIITE